MTLSTPSQKHPEASQATSASQHVEPTGEDPQGVSVAIASLGLAQSRAEARANGARSPRVATTTARARARVEAERPAAIARNAPPPRRVANSSRVDMRAPKTPAMRPRGGVQRAVVGVPTSGCDNLVPESRAFQKPDASPARLERRARDARAPARACHGSKTGTEIREGDRAGRRSIAGARPRIQRFPFAAKRNARSPPEFPEIFSKSAARVFPRAARRVGVRFVPRGAAAGCSASLWSEGGSGRGVRVRTMSRNVRNAPGAWGRRKFEEEVRPTPATSSPMPRRIRAVPCRPRFLARPPADTPPSPPSIAAAPPRVGLPPVGFGTLGRAPSRGARWANVVGVVLVVVGTMSALALTGWHQVVRGLEAYDTSHEARAAHTPFPLTAHEIWLGDEMPKVKRMLYERNEEMLAPWGWNLRLWGLGDVTPEHRPAHARRDPARPRAPRSNRRQRLQHARRSDEVRDPLSARRSVPRHQRRTLPRPLAAVLGHRRGEARALFVADPGDNRFISAGMIGALAPGTALLGRVVDDPAYLDGIDFARHCIANALTGPVLLTMHLGRDPALLGR